MDPNPTRIELINNFDVVMARQKVRELAREMGFGLTDQTRIATAVSEISRRAMENHGEISFSVVTEEARQGIECVCRGCEWREPPAGAPSGEILGGIRGVERLMDDFHPEERGAQTVIVMRKWLRSP